MIIKIARKELKSLFASPMGWVILALLQFVFGTFFLIGVDQYFQTMSGMVRPEQRLGVTEFVGHNVFSIASFAPTERSAGRCRGRLRSSTTRATSSNGSARRAT